MVAQDGHSSVGPVVGQDLGRNVFLRCREERNAESGAEKGPSLRPAQFSLSRGPLIKA